MKKITTIILAFLSVTSIAQNIKTYSGKYESGTATYQYYEDDNYERILNGSFNYIEYVVFNAERKISGTYKQNNKEGKWLCTINLATKSPRNVTSNSIITGNFINGLREGIWTSNNKTSVDKKPAQNEANSITLLKNMLIGNINTKQVKGQLNDKGEFIGKWTILDRNTEYIAEFHNNIFKKLIVRNITNGNISLRYIDNETALFDNSETITVNSQKYGLAKSQNLRTGYQLDYAKLGLDSAKLSSTELSDYSNLLKEYFTKFIEYIDKSIKFIETPFENLKGSSPIIINYPKVSYVEESINLDEEE